MMLSRLMTFVQKNKLYFIGACLGAVAGFFYWKLVGCQTGTCAITTSPLNSSVYFAMMGSLIFGMFQKKDVTNLNKQTDN